MDTQALLSQLILVFSSTQTAKSPKQSLLWALLTILKLKAMRNQLLGLHIHPFFELLQSWVVFVVVHLPVLFFQLGNDVLQASIIH